MERFVPKKLRKKETRPLWMTKEKLRKIRKKRRFWRSYTPTEGRTGNNYQSFQAFKAVQKEVDKLGLS